MLLFSAYLIPVSVCLNAATFHCVDSNFLVWDIYQDKRNIFSYPFDSASMVGERLFQIVLGINTYVELILKNSSLLHSTLLHSTLTINGTHLNPRLRIECSRSGQQLLDFQSKLISQFDVNT